MRFLVNYLLLKPYGNRLLESDAKQWISSLVVVVYLMSIIEGTIWGALAYFYFRYSSSSDVAALIGISVSFIIAITIWQIDASFVRYEVKESIFSKHAWKTNKAEMLRLSASIVGRILIIVFSSLITAQNVSKLIYIEDVKKAIEDENSKKKAYLYNELLLEYDGLINSAEQKYETTLKELTDEVAGKGPSKRHGDKEVAGTFRERARVDSLKWRALEQKQRDTLSFIHNASDKELQKIRPDYEYKSLTPKTISEKIKELESTEDNFLTWLTRGFIWFLFLLLILIKLLQGKSLSYYFNSELQAKYLDLLAGRIDDTYLVGWKVDLKRNPESISVFDFHEWYYEWFQPRHEKLKKDEELRLLTENLDKLTQQINELILDANTYTENLKIKFSEKVEQENGILETTDQKSSIEESISNLNTTLLSLKSLDVSDLGSSQIGQITTRISQSEKSLMNLAVSLKEKIRALSISNMLKEVMTKEYETLEKLTNEVNSFLEKLQLTKLELRKHFVDNIGKKK